MPSAQDTSSTLDTIAETIWRATVPAAAEKGLTFSEMAESTHKVFRVMAQAALDALGLTEEHATIPQPVNDTPCTCTPDPGFHQLGCDWTWHFEFHPSTRLVGPWTRDGDAG